MLWVMVNSSGNAGTLSVYDANGNGEGRAADKLIRRAYGYGVDSIDVASKIYGQLLEYIVAGTMKPSLCLNRVPESGRS